MRSVQASVLLGALACVSAIPRYELRSAWPKWGDYASKIAKVTAVASVPSSHREYAIVLQRAPGVEPIFAFDYESGDMLGSPYGSTFLSSPHGAHVIGPMANGSSFLYVTDVGDGSAGHTVHMLEVQPWDGSGAPPTPVLLRSFGTPGQAGTGLHPIQFGSVADVAGTPSDPDHVYIVDGDGGPNNRLLKLDVRSGEVVWHVGGAAGAGRGSFSVPHSVTLDTGAAGGGRLWVADRSNNRTVALGTDGEWQGEWNCSRPGMPWGVRADAGRRRLMIADGLLGRVMVADLAGADGQLPGACRVLATIPAGPGASHPHEMALRQSTGDLLLASVGDPTSVRLFTRKE